MTVQEFIETLLNEYDDLPEHRPAKWFCEHVKKNLQADEEWAIKNGWKHDDAVRNLTVSCVVGASCIKLFLAQLQVVQMMDSLSEAEVAGIVEAVVSQMGVWMYG